jgi:hypothetical protein
LPSRREFAFDAANVFDDTREAEQCFPCLVSHALSET